MTYNYNKLRGRIVEFFGTQADFAKAMGWSERALSLHMNSKTEWKQGDMVKAMTLLHIDLCDVGEYFFVLESSEI